MKETLAKKSIKLEVREKVILWKLMFRKAREEIQACFWVYDRTEEIIELDEETFASFRSWAEIREDSGNKSKRYKTQTIEVIAYIRYYQNQLQITSRSNWADMIEFDEMLLTHQDILTFELYKQLEELVRIAQRTKQLENWKHHVRSLQIYCRFDRLSTARISRTFCDDIDSRVSNSASSKTLRERNKEFKEEASSKEIWVSENWTSVVKNSDFKASSSFRVKISREINWLFWESNRS